MFSSLTSPSYPKAAIGLESAAITALALRRDGGRFAIRQGASVELPKGVLNPAFAEKNIVSAPQFRVILEEAVTSAGLLNQKRWSVSLPAESARSAIISLDSASAGRGDLDEVIDWKAEQTFGLPAAQMRITRHRIASDTDGKARFFATAVRLSVIDEYESVFEALGWKAGLVLPRPLSESNWLIGDRSGRDSILVSSQNDGFTALLLRKNEPNVVRSVTCAASERDDEIFRLLMFYKDRVAKPNGEDLLDSLMVVGADLSPAKIREISADALGYALRVLSPADVGLELPEGHLRFDEVAAPAGLAALGWA